MLLLSDSFPRVCLSKGKSALPLIWSGGFAGFWTCVSHRVCFDTGRKDRLPGKLWWGPCLPTHTFRYFSDLSSHHQNHTRKWPWIPLVQGLSLVTLGMKYGRAFCSMPKLEESFKDSDISNKKTTGNHWDLGRIVNCHEIFNVLRC